MSSLFWHRTKMERVAREQNFPIFFRLPDTLQRTSCERGGRRLKGDRTLPRPPCKAAVGGASIGPGPFRSRPARQAVRAEPGRALSAFRETATAAQVFFLFKTSRLNVALLARLGKIEGLSSFASFFLFLSLRTKRLREKIFRFFHSWQKFLKRRERKILNRFKILSFLLFWKRGILKRPLRSWAAHHRPLKDAEMSRLESYSTSPPS